MLHVICLVIIMQMDSGAALADLYYIASSLSVIHNPTPGANWICFKEETESSKHVLNTGTDTHSQTDISHFSLPNNVVFQSKPSFHTLS